MVDRTVRDVDIVIGEDDLRSLIDAFGKSKKAALVKNNKKPGLSEDTLYNICCDIAETINSSKTISTSLEVSIVCPENVNEGKRLEHIKKLLETLASNNESCRTKTGKPKIGTSKGGIIGLLRKPKFNGMLNLNSYSDSTYQHYFRQALRKK